jgi:NIMA-interacting peptidyl-prolyl cis-trans isomerase 1
MLPVGGWRHCSTLFGVLRKKADSQQHGTLSMSRRIGCHAKGALLPEADGTPPHAPIALIRSCIYTSIPTSIYAYTAHSSFPLTTLPPRHPTILIALHFRRLVNNGKLYSSFARHSRVSAHNAQSSAETGLPQGWEVRRSNTKNLPYYFHPETKDSRWEPPAGTDPEKLKEFMAQHHSSKGVAPASSSHEGGNKIRVVHLLVKHRDSRRPASWREPKITRSKEEARELIQRYQVQIKAFEAGESGGNAKSLSDLATTESDCSSARKGGDL